jgi:hypothetical protein
MSDGREKEKSDSVADDGGIDPTCDERREVRLPAVDSKTIL